MYYKYIYVYIDMLYMYRHWRGECNYVASGESSLHLTKETSVILLDEIYIPKYPILYCDIPVCHTTSTTAGGEGCLLICGGDSGASFIGQPVYMMSLT